MEYVTFKDNICAVRKKSSTFDRVVQEYCSGGLRFELQLSSCPPATCSQSKEVKTEFSLPLTGHRQHEPPRVCTRKNSASPLLYSCPKLNILNHHKETLDKAKLGAIL